MEKLIRRTLETVGGSVDRLFGRGRKPDALPQTHDLGERLRKMIDERAQINQSGRKLAPHLIRLKYAWGQSSDEFLTALKKLENELLLAALDHINDNRYATLAPVKIQSKADILTEGFAMSLGFDETELQESEPVAIPVEIYAKLLPPEFQTKPAAKPTQITITAVAMLPNGTERKTNLTAAVGEKANFIVGRIKECDLYLDDQSVSKHHASLVFSTDGALKVADVGSTNGTFLDGKRITYGKAYEISIEKTIAFGDVKVRFEWEMPAPEIAPEPATTENSVSRENVNADGELKIGVASMKRSTPAEVLEKTSDELKNIESNERKTQDDEDDITILDRHRPAPKTFFDSELANDDAPRTFIDAELRENPPVNLTETSGKSSGEQSAGAPKTFIDHELNQAPASFVNKIEDGAPETVFGETPPDAEQTFVESSQPKKDFTQSLPRLNDEAANFGQTGGEPSSNGAERREN